MRLVVGAIAWLTVIVLVGACSTAGSDPNDGDPTDRPESSSLPMPSETANNLAWTLIFEVSGGFAGEFQRVELHADGTYVAQDIKRELEERGTLAPEDLISIEELLVAAPEASDGGRPPPCADCFLYALHVSQDDKKRLSFALNDISLVGSPLEPLVRALLAIYADAIQVGN